MERANGPTTILIANDQEWSARSLESILTAEGYEVLRAFTGGQALQRATEARPDIIILDRQMPDIGGTEVCRRLRADPMFGPTTPIIITTAGPAGRTQRLEAFESGAWDFMGQPIDGEVILLKVRTFLEAKRAADASRNHALLDAATGLYTRDGLARRAREIAADAMRHHQPVACVVFSPETPALEAALVTAEDLVQEITRFFRSSGRGADAVGRLGPLEFGVIAPATTVDGVGRMIGRIETAVAASTSPALQAEGRITLRAGYWGVSDFAESSIDPAEMIERAGAALKVPLEVPPAR